MNSSGRKLEHWATRSHCPTNPAWGIEPHAGATLIQGVGMQDSPATTTAFLDFIEEVMHADMHIEEWDKFYDQRERTSTS